MSVRSAMSDLMKEGTTHLTGIEEAVFKNIEAVKEITAMVKTSFGPNGQNKMIVNHLSKLFVTNDAATILREVEVFHPAANILVQAAHAQENECGDATNLVMIFGGELLEKAMGLMRMGLHPSEIVTGYTLAYNETIKRLDALATEKVTELSRAQLQRAIRGAIASKQYGYEGFVSGLVTDACLMVMPSQPAEFNVDNVRVVKILGGGVSDSVVVKGMVFGRAPEGTVKSATDCKVAIFTCPIDLAKTETKGTVVFRNAEELKAFSTGEEAQMEAIIRGIAETGVKCIVAGSSLADIALHYCEKYRLVVVRVQSKFEIRRLAKSVKAVPLVRLGAPVAEEIGHCDKIFTDEIGSNQVTVFRQEADDSAIATVVVRASTKNVADDIERAIDDGVNSIKQICRDPRLVPGCGATEMELARHVTAYGLTRSGLDQYAIQQYGISFEAIPRLLAESAGQKATERIADLYAAHESGNKQAGVDIESGSALIDASSAGLLDIVSTKRNALRVATEAATTILRIDQIIMARAAGGPKPPKQGQGMDSDD